MAEAREAPWPAPLHDIDWGRPWMAPYRTVGHPIADAVLQGADLCAALTESALACGLANAAGMPLCFVPQTALAKGVAYEAHIHATGAVPTRENLHDFFNALVWLHFPQAKAVLNRIQADQIAALGIQTRGGVRDAATLFDENAVIFQCDNLILRDALRNFHWYQLFVEERGAWQDCRVVVFGHALMEKLVTPYRAVTAHAWALDGPVALALPDAALAVSLAHAPLHSRRFAPLPVMGIPGWCEKNEDPAFYRDTTVFRPGRRQGRGI